MFERLPSYLDALHVILSHAQTLESEVVDLNECHGRVLAEDVYATIDVPPFDRASMDGYAVRAKDTVGATRFSPAILRITGKDVLDEFEAFEISTGEPLPKNSNSVIMYEDTERNNGELYIFKQAHPYMNVSRRGEDIKSGHIVIEKGCRLNIFDVAMLSSLGIRKVKVRRRPRVGVISTGDELIEPGEKLEHGKIYDSSNILVSYILKKLGCEVIRKRIKDDEREITRIFDEIDDFDIVVFTGGTSLGKRDILVELMNELGNAVVHGVAIQPAKPFGFYLLKEKPIFLLSGYPVAAFIGAFMFLRYFLLRMLGRKDNTVKMEVKLKKKVPSTVGRREFVRVHVDFEKGECIPVASRGSGVLSKLAESNGILEIEEDCEGFNAGDNVKVMLIYQSLW